MLSQLLLAGLLATTASPAASPAPNSHLWRVNEVFSNADGTVQFVELLECCGSTIEVQLANKSLTCAGSGNAFTFPADLTEQTANRHLLLATAGFAALPGAPTPDHILPDGFFDVNGDTLQWHIYPLSVLSFGAGELPMDGFQSLAQSGATGPNSPTNFAGVSGQINLGVAVPALPVQGMLALAGGLLLSAAFVLRRRSRA